MKLQLPDVTLFCADCQNYGPAINALRKSMEQVDFGAVVFATDIPIKEEGIKVVQIETIRSKREYSELLVKQLINYFETPYVLVVQHDGYVLDASAWNDDFLDYDYIGAPWLYTDGRNVGNGGFSLRSALLQIALYQDDFIEVTSPEDEVIGRLYREYLEIKHEIKFAPETLADKFSFELRTPTSSTFGFHGNFHAPYKPYVQIRRWAAMGDVVTVEPVLREYHRLGYNVILETHPSFFKLFQQHDFPILHPQQIDPRIERKYVNLDMSYEANPDMNHLDAYFKYAGLEPQNVNPKLNLHFDAKSPQYKLFPKYALIHIDYREQHGRNVYGVDWETVVKTLNDWGYTAVQVGKNDHEVIAGAVQFNCNTEELLLMTCAGADLFIGIDSGVSHICNAFDVPCIVFFGSVSPSRIHKIPKNIHYISNHSITHVCDKPYCWHSVSGTTGVPCYIDEKKPPCAIFDTERVINKIFEVCNFLDV